MDTPLFQEVTAILAQTTDESAERLVTAVVAAPRLFVMALGRSGLILRMFAMRLMQIGLAVHVVGDVTTPAIAPGDLLIVLSGSGLDRDGGDPGTQGLGSLGARVLAITSGAATPLPALADEVIVLPAGSVKHDSATPTRPAAGQRAGAGHGHLSRLCRCHGWPSAAVRTTQP